MVSMQNFPYIPFLQDRVLVVWLFIKLLIPKIIHDRCAQVASALTYTTLLALVPVISIALAFFTNFPGYEVLIMQSQSFVMDVLTPNIGKDVVEYLFTFANKARGLNTLSLLILVGTLFLTLNTIDTVFNRIWRVRPKRRVAISLLAYILVLLLGPLLIGGSILLTTYLASFHLLDIVLEQPETKNFTLSLLPVLVTTLAFTMMYRWIPRAFVAWRYAMVGGFLAACMFELAKHGFVLYITWFPTYEVIYGALAVIPLLLIWIYVSWLIVLTGAEVACCLGLFTPKHVSERIDRPEPFVHAFRVLGYLWQSKEWGMHFSRILALEPVSGEWLQGLLAYMEQKGLVEQNKRGNWSLQHDLRNFTLLDLSRTLDRLPPARGLVANPLSTHWDQQLDIALQELAAQLNHLGDKPLSDLYQQQFEAEEKK